MAAGANRATVAVSRIAPHACAVCGGSDGITNSNSARNQPLALQLMTSDVRPPAGPQAACATITVSPPA